MRQDMLAYLITQIRKQFCVIVQARLREKSLKIRHGVPDLFCGISRSDKALPLSIAYC